VLKSAPQHEGTWANGGIGPRILYLDSG